MTMLARWRVLIPARRRLLLAVLVALARAAMQVRLVPFPRLATRLGPMVPPRTSPPAGPGRTEQARDLRWALAAVLRHTPLRPACLAQALAARRICIARGLPCVLHLGAEAGRGDGETHAWLDAAGVPVTGYPLPVGMVEVGCFVTE